MITLIPLQNFMVWFTKESLWVRKNYIASVHNVVNIYKYTCELQYRNIALIYLCYFLKQNINSTYKISSIEFFGRKLYTHLSV